MATAWHPSWPGPRNRLPNAPMRHPMTPATIAVGCTVTMISQRAVGAISCHDIRRGVRLCISYCRCKESNRGVYAWGTGFEEYIHHPSKSYTVF